MLKNTKHSRLDQAVRAALAGSAIAMSAPVYAQSYSRTDTIVYSDNTNKWVLGQVASSTNNDTGTGIVESSTAYDPTTALPIRIYGPGGKLRQTLTYNADGTLATIKDGKNNITTLSSWKLGIPQTIKYPVTPESPTGAVESAVVSNAGWIDSATDENGYKTCYTYDSMGRMATVTYPSETVAGACATSTWAATSQTFVQVPTTAEYGIAGGHWKQTVSTGNARKVTYFDALLRPLVQDTYDNGNVAPTRSIHVTRYDLGGRSSYQSYALNTLSNYAAVTVGTRTTYDALGRSVRVEQDSELGILASTTLYQPGFTTLATNPRGFQTSTSYLTYDQPITDWPMSIAAAIGRPVERHIDIARDVFGKPLSVTQSDPAGTVSATRKFVYNPAQELCKRIEPETGSTLQHFDAAGNIDWSASGLGLPDTASCDDTNATVAARKVTRLYDARNRPVSMAFPDTKGNEIWHYTPDGQLANSTTFNENGAITGVDNAYSYNRRRLLTGETLVYGAITQSIGYAYDANGHLSVNTYPSGMVVDYQPNALGQATRAGNDGSPNPFAWGAQYYPNGALSYFSYGNGIRHTMTQNARGLPDRSRDANDAGVAVLDDSYDYDANGNVAAISDGLSNAPTNRTMGYDALDRLMTTTSPMYSSILPDSTARYTYDALDNLTHVVAPGPRDQYYCYDDFWHLTNIMTGSCSGVTVEGLGYDLQGNVSNKSGTLYSFDFGNRLRTVTRAGATIESYRYDGFGRRVSASSPTLGDIVSQYSRDGQLLFQVNQRTGVTIEYVYFAGSLVGRREKTSAGIYANKYEHTDALGSPVAVTNGPQSKLEYNQYEPYGKVINHALMDGPGYTGHVGDAVTGLDYMQQRYYDPGIGRFLSVDPVTTDGNSGANFNRYWYANNNPYRFTDPDGRCPVCVVAAVEGAEFAAGFLVDVATQMWVGGKSIGDVDYKDAVAAGVVGMVIPGVEEAGSVAIQSAKETTQAVKAIAKVSSKAANTANRAAKNAASVAKNVEKITNATANVGKATVAAATHEAVKAEVHSVTHGDVKQPASGSSIRTPPPPPPPDAHGN